MRLYPNLELQSGLSRVNHLLFQLCIATHYFEPCRAVTPFDSTHQHQSLSLETSPARQPIDPQSLEPMSAPSSLLYSRLALPFPASADLLEDNHLT